MLCKDGGFNEKLGIYTQRDGNNSIQFKTKEMKNCFVSGVSNVQHCQIEIWNSVLKKSSLLKNSKFSGFLQTNAVNVMFREKKNNFEKFGGFLAGLDAKCLANKQIFGRFLCSNSKWWYVWDLNPVLCFATGISTSFTRSRTRRFSDNFGPIHFLQA